MRKMLWLWVCLVVAWQPAVAQEDPRRTPVVLAVERALPAVVTVKVEVQTASPFMRFGAEARASEGSGVIIDAQGLVLTNAHVVDGARAIEVHLQDGRSFQGDVVAQDPSIDLAVLRLRGASDLPIIPLGNSDDLLLGEPAIAIGNPFGLGHTVSTGVIGSGGRDVSMGDGPKQTYIQTDAAINPGNSGGALVNIYGQLIGINTFIHSAGQGIGFAIPANRARKVADDLLRFGQVQIPWLGVSLVDVSPRRSQGRILDGAVAIGRVDDPGVARRGLLRVGDVVLEVDGHRVFTRADLNARLAERSPGDDIQLVLLREQSRVKVAVQGKSVPPGLGDGVIGGTLRVRLEPVRGGLQVTEAGEGGTWLAAGLKPGDIIVGIDGERVRGVEDLAVRLGQARSLHRASAWFVVARGPYQGTVEIAL